MRPTKLIYQIYFSSVLWHYNEYKKLLWARKMCERAIKNVCVGTLTITLLWWTEERGRKWLNHRVAINFLSNSLSIYLPLTFIYSFICSLSISIHLNKRGKMNIVEEKENLFIMNLLNLQGIESFFTLWERKKFKYFFKLSTPRLIAFSILYTV